MRFFIRSCSAILMVGLLGAGSQLRADEWFVDDDNYREDCSTYEEYKAAGFDGTTEAKAVGTIQAAVGKASAGDTVTVLPGTYDKGGSYSSAFGWSRVSLSRAITLRSRDGATATHIVGEPDSETGTCGANACRCVCAPVHNAVVRGFTLRDGYTGPSQNDAGRGGILHANKTEDSYLVDCVVSNCVSRQGGLFYGTAIRCRFVRNWSNDTGGIVLGYNSSFHNCLMADNCDPGLYTVWGGKIVNCTITGNSHGNGVAARNAGHLQLYNTIIDANCKTYTESAGSLEDANNSPKTEYSLMAPALDDFRVRAGSVADGGADRQWLELITLPEGENAYLDCDRRPIPKTGSFHIGCFQQVASPAGGRVESGSVNMSFDGFKTCPTVSYAYPTVWPTQFLVKAELQENQAVYGYSVAPAERIWRAANPLGGFFALAPSAVTDYFKVTSYLATDVLWVSAGADGSDETGDGTEAKPYKTIQKAVDVAPLYKSTARKYTVVYVKPGTYGAGEGHYPKDTAGAEVTTHGKAAVTIYDRYVRLVSTDGPEKTIIVGTPDPDYADDATAPGCGPNAVRCALFTGENGNGLTGFTLTGGATGREGDARYGGGYDAPSGHAIITDSIISNNVGMIGAGGARGVNYRNYFTDNRGPQGTAGGWYSVFVGCVFKANPSSRCGYGTIMSDSNVFHCLLIGETDEDAVVQNSSSMLFYNSIVVGGKDLGTSVKSDGTVFWNVADWQPRTGGLYDDPCFADAANGDYRLLKCSPALDHGDPTVSKYIQYADTGFDGRPLKFVGGCPIPGPFQEIVRSDAAKVYVSLPNGGAAVSGGEAGLVDLGTDGVLSLSPANGTRPCVGFLVDGVTNLYADLPNGTLTIAAAAAKAAGSVRLTALYDDEWYADAVGGSDGNPGCAAYPLRTLADSMKYAVSGDTVHAAPGDYNEGLMGQSDTACISSRVVVASGVRLVADRGPDVTFISGSNATVGVKTGTYAGCGANAVRCVYLRPNARIEGFTVRNGRFNGESPDSADSRPGGVYGESPSTSVAYGCVVTNCWGYRGGNAYSACLVNCLLVGGKTQQGAAGFLCSFHGCCCKSDGICNNGQIYQPRGTGVSGCTIDAGSNYSSMANVETSYAGSITNVVFLSGGIKATEAKPLTLVNCLVAEECIAEENRPYITLINTVVTNREAIAIGADWRPQPGSPAIDTGLTAGINPIVGDRDATDGQRVYNGTVDIGAVEYDWRPDYAAAIGDSVTVTNATSGVILADGKVRLTDGAAIAGTWPQGDLERNARYTVTEKATDGTLTGSFLAGDELVSTRSTTDSTISETFKAKASALGWAYSFAASEDDGYGEVGPFSYAPPPGVLLIVR